MPEAALLEPPVVAPQPAAANGPLADLILCRLLVAPPKGVGVAVLAKAVGEAYRSPPSRERVAEAVAGLKATGLLAVGKGQKLSEAGRDRALAFLGVAELPANANWGTVKARFLLPKALGRPADEVGTAGKLAAVLLRQRFELPAAAGQTPAGALEALACKLLGFPDLLSLKAVAAAVISRELDVDPPLAAETLATAGPRVLLGARKAGLDGLRAVALAGLTDPAGPDGEPPAEPLDLEAFAETVLAVARHCPTGRFGDSKVFIAHVWRQAQAEPQFPRLKLAEFKARLVEANRARLLTLGRADLVQFMDPADVRESATEYLGSEFHFVLTERE